MGLFNIDIGGGQWAELGQKLLGMFPDAEQRAKAQNAIRDFEQTIAQGQVQINAIEAASGNWFISGWRPALGWVCVISFTYSLVQPMTFLPAIDGVKVENTLWLLLGFGAMRTAEKLSGVATRAIKGLFK
jgi:hypothetical protein